MGKIPNNPRHELDKSIVTKRVSSWKLFPKCSGSREEPGQVERTFHQWNMKGIMADSRESLIQGTFSIFLQCYSHFRRHKNHTRSKVIKWHRSLVNMEKIPVKRRLKLSRSHHFGNRFHKATVPTNKYYLRFFSHHLLK